MPPPDHPPRPRLVLAVGVTGHRPEGLSGADPRRLRVETARVLGLAAEVLAEAAEEDRCRLLPAFSGETPLLRVVSPLADGADRIVAEEGLRLSARVEVALQCPLPFAVEDYRKDFDASSAAAFDALRSGRPVLELDGSRQSGALTSEAYEAAGWVVLDQCDLLIAIWDGKAPRGLGGTGQIVHEALRRGIPTVWIHADAAAVPDDHASCLLGWAEAGPRCGGQTSLLRERLRPVLMPKQREAAAVYYGERAKSWNVGAFWQLFRDLAGRRGLSLPALRLRPPDGSGDAQYAWADHLANYYASVYRSSFLLNYLFGAAAVLLALMPLALGSQDGHRHGLDFSRIFAAGELALILAILANTWMGLKARWHERWLDYRLLAEYLRQASMLAPLGRLEIISPPPSSDGAGDPRGTWMYWLARAAVREAGIQTRRIDAAFLDGYKASLRSHLAEQRDYHERNARLLHSFGRTLAAAGAALFAATLVACGAHLFLHSPWLTWVAAVFPAFGAAFAGIRSHAELELLVKRSEAAAAGIERLVRELDRPDLLASSRVLGAVALDAAGLMIHENLGWRLVSEARPLELA
ncbi:MAG TPA: hypothetical protein DD417_03665 [Elusimicrobia bacterium]|nr:hypothetical protein [Elusimicrobiota bacterium]